MKARTILGRARGAGDGPRTAKGRTLRRARLIGLVLSMALAFAAIQLGALPLSPVRPPAADAASYAPITGAGSTWAYPAIHAWIENLNQYGISNIYTANGSSSGRQYFAGGQSDWAASEIPYGVVDGANTDSPPSRDFVYIPDVAGGTTLMYNLSINGQRVTNLRLSPDTVAGIFTNKITMWNNPAIEKDNPDLKLPALAITPVVRSDGSGATSDFTSWMLAVDPSAWEAYCQVVGRTPCTQTSTYPPEPGTNMKAQSGDPGVATYVAQSSSDGAIGYVEYSWALTEQFPVAKLLNAAGYYTLPSPGHVAVSLLQDQINTSNPNDPTTYLTQNLSGVYTNKDPRNYELSAYSYFILPTDLTHGMTDSKGYTIGTFGSYALCLGQAQVDQLGYSALPINLVKDAFSQLQKVPGSTVPTETTAAIASCHNPTFSTSGVNTLAKDDPQPLACDKYGSTQCAPGVQEPTEAGVSITVTSGGASGGGGSSSGGSSGGGSSGGGSSGGGSSGGGSSGGGSSGGGSSSGGSTTGTGQTCDPNTGVCSSPTGSSTGSSDGASNTGDGSSTGSDQAVSDNPITLAGNNSNGVQVALMAIAAALLLALSVVPPLIAQAGRRSRQRRGIDEFYEGNDRR
jgi:ABC-type phosphate transport system substrate-binding protein